MQSIQYVETQMFTTNDSGLRLLCRECAATSLIRYPLTHSISQCPLMSPVRLKYVCIIYFHSKPDLFPGSVVIGSTNSHPVKGVPFLHVFPESAEMK